MDRKSIIALVLITGLWFFWLKTVAPPIPEKGGSEDSQVLSKTISDESFPSQVAEKGELHTSTPTLKTPESASLKTQVIENEQASIEISNQPPFIRAWKLKGYKRELGLDSENISLAEKFGFSPTLVFGGSSSIQNAVYQISKPATNQVRLAFKGKDYLITHLFSLPLKESTRSPFALAIETSVSSPTQPLGEKFYWSIQSKPLEGSSGGGIFSGPQLNERKTLIYSDHKVESNQLELDRSIKKVNSRWVAFSSRYFLLGLVGDAYVNQSQNKDHTIELIPNSEAVEAIFPVDLTGGIHRQVLYFGPKEISHLQSVSPTIDQSLDFGWFSFLSILMLKLLKKFYGFLGNYGLAIILLTFLVRLITFPLQYKSTKSMKEMQKIQPKISQIKEKYKDDKEKLNREMMLLMKNNKVNPLGGCLPLLVQMPIFIALYRVLYGSIELFHSPFYFWIKDLSLKDPHYILPVLMGITMFIQQKLTPMTTADPNQKKVMALMPVIFTVFMVSLPSGLNLYIFVSTLMGIFQQLWMNKKFNIKTSMTDGETKAVVSGASS